MLRLEIHTQLVQGTHSERRPDHHFNPQQSTMGTELHVKAFATRISVVKHSP